MKKVNYRAVIERLAVEDRVIETGFTAFHFDSRNPPAELMALTNDCLTLVGGINKPQPLLNGRVTEVKAEVERLLQAGIRLAALECAVPRGS